MMSADTKLHIVIADDQHIFRDGLRMMLDKESDLVVTGEAANGQELVSVVAALRPDVVVTDLMMPVMNGVEAIKQLRRLGNDVPCIALSTFNNELMVVEAMEAGALGYIIKNAEKGEIAAAIRTVYEGHPYYCKSTSAKVTKLLVHSPFNPYSRMKPALFTEREKEIIKLICQEKTSEEISKTLCIGVRTIESDRAKILEKMNVKTIAGVVIYAIKNYLYEVQ